MVTHEAPELFIGDIRHPFYDLKFRDWELWRRTYETGSRYLELYLRKFSSRESDDDFKMRKEVSYVPAFAKEAVDEVKNSIFNRFCDISREGGSKNYQDAAQGDRVGVDLLGKSMNAFVGVNILPELLVMGRVGVFVDMQPTQGVSLAYASTKRPYIYMYTAEEICSWELDDKAEPNQFTKLLLRENYITYDVKFNLPNGIAQRYRYMFQADGGVYLAYYSSIGQMMNQFGQEIMQPIFYPIPRIPFILFELSDSLMCDIAQYQIALTNMASADVNFSLKSNYPFYTEQYDARADSPYIRRGANNPDGSAAANSDGQAGTVINTGDTQGRRYPVGTERPDFINPSPEPMRLSMEKQQQLKEEIRHLVGLTVANLAPTKQASAESKRADNQTLESGLSYIGLVLQHGENRIADYWAMYEGLNAEAADITYPDKYYLKTNDEVAIELKAYKDHVPLVPSTTFQRYCSKEIAWLLLGNKLPAKAMEKIYAEIDSGLALFSDPGVLYKDIEQGILAKKYAAELKGYPKDSVEIATTEQADRLAIIAISQAKGQGAGAARGVPDASPDPNADVQSEKTAAKNAAGKDITRGPGKTPAANQGANGG